MSIHFYNFRSRLGMLNLPFGQDEFNIGVENGGDAVLTDEFIAGFPNGKLDILDFPLPEAIDRKQYFNELFRASQKAIALIEDTLEETEETQVVVGGDHSVAFCSLAELLRRMHISDVGYIQVDSHPDINTIATSPSGNFHGMWMRPFVGDFENDLIVSLVPHRLLPHQILYIGNLDLNPEEKEFIEKNNIQTISVTDMRKQTGKSQKHIQEFMKKFKHIHLDIDIDGFDKSIAPATGIPAEKGLLSKDVEHLLRSFSKLSSKSLDLVEVNPEKEGADQTIELAQTILRTALQ